MHFKEPAQIHVHSKFSLLDAIPSPKEWVGWCLENKVPGVAITDHGVATSLYDVLKFPKYIQEYNKEHKTNYPDGAVIGIPGIELYLKLFADDSSHYHITIWAMNNQGYANLMKLASLAYKDTVEYFGNTKARITLDMLCQHKDGLKIGTACIANPIGRAIMDDDEERAEKIFVAFKDAIGDDFYVEFHPTDITHNFDKKNGGFNRIKPSQLAPDGNKQKAYNLFLAKMIDKYSCKAVPASDAHFLAPEDKIIQDALLKAGNDNGWYFHESYHAKKAEEMFLKLKEHLGDWLTEEKYAKWIENTYEIMECAKTIRIKHEYHLPKIEIPQYIQDKNDDYNKQLFYLLMERIKVHGRWRDDPIYIARFKKEIDVIAHNATLNFIPYFLIYEDICNFARSQNILQNIGRGSAGGCLLSYYLKIIHIDPISADLPFERFLSHSRIKAGSFPDIDCDFGHRGPIVKYLKQKYGLGFAQIATFQKMKTKNAIKDAMLALHGRNRKDPEIEAICRTIPDSMQGVDEHDFLYGFTDKEDTYHPGQVEVNERLASFFKQYPEVEKLVKRMLGIVRGFGRHASAFVISTVDLSNGRIPTMIMHDDDSGEELLVTQFDASMVEASGLVKADILGVTTINMVSDCMDLILKRHNVDFFKEDNLGVAAIYRLKEDESVYADFYNKKTDSSFQFNTATVKTNIQKICPVRREDLSETTALLRPGAMDALVDFKAVTMVEYDDGSVDFYSEGEYDIWLAKMHAQMRN